MKVLLVTDGIFPYVMGGMQKHSYYLGKYLAKAGIQVHLVHCAPGNPSANEFELPEFASFDQNHISFSRVPEPERGSLPGHYLRESRRYAEDVYARMKGRLGEFDLIYCQGFTGLGFIQGRKRGEVKIPVVSNLHGYEMYQRMPSLKARLGRAPLRSMAREVSLGSDAVFSFGGQITGILKRIGVAPERILECPIGIEERWIDGVVPTVSGGVRSFVFVGRNERRKGIKELRIALKELHADGKDGFLFRMVGPIPKEEQLKAGNITYHGSLTEEEHVRNVMRAADVLVCPSYAEGMPTVIMEAMASGLAILATDVGAVARQVDAGNGWLLPAPRPELVKAAMEEAIRMPAEQLLQLKERSLAKARERFTWERVITCKVNALEDAIRNFVP
ncbi:MAG: glycosyltransferase family 4 protein [Flavobacteriales bacterium]|nr:glycosyltransferase family 4 protein [Flavobacteriales bacterium]